MSDFKLIIPENKREFLVETIREAGGNEVFFLGKVEWGKEEDSATLGELDVLARGNSVSAPAIIQGAEKWDIAIHNHPSGGLTPSEADISVASELGNRQVGFAIIDNQAERCYLVVPPLRSTPIQDIDPNLVENHFNEGGALDETLTEAEGKGSYQARRGQIELAKDIALALNQNRIVACEAGTGVGKSFAYLIPSILWATANKRRVIVSTNTINLQEQLIQKDLPFLSKALDVEFTYALIKGRGNYACIRKAEELRGETANLFDDEQFSEQLSDLLSWVGKTEDGSRSDLAMTPSPQVWDHVMSETDKSLKVKCDHYSKCFYYKAKREAFKADILIVNHHLFFADLALRRETDNYQYDMLLPAYDRVVFDEAHHLEDVASAHLGHSFTQEGVQQRMGRLVSKNNQKKGVLPNLARQLRKEGAAPAAETIETKFIPEVPDIAQRIEDAFDELVYYLEQFEENFRSERGSQELREGDDRPTNFVIRLTGEVEQVELSQAMGERLDTIHEQLTRLSRLNVRALQALKASGGLEAKRKDSLMLELSSLSTRLERLMETVLFFRDDHDKKNVKWLEVRPSRRRREEFQNRLRLASSPVRVSKILKESVYEPMKSVVMTSATLSISGHASFYEDRVGLRGLPDDRYHFQEFQSPFHYPSQALLLLPEDLPDPRSPEFEINTHRAIYRIIERLKGRTFVLFTSYASLIRAHERLEPEFTKMGVRILRQGEQGRTELLEAFKGHPNSVLFGTDSFWEGVDVKGEALECVVITKLPFRVPTEPVQIARVEELESRGISPFPHYTVPQAILKFKQGFGRLIRTDKDRGVVFVLDSRILQKSYGQKFIKSLPPANRIRGTFKYCVQKMETFFK